MPSSPENSDPASVQQAADQHAEEILARRRASRALRAAAIKAHSQPISIKDLCVKIYAADETGTFRNCLLKYQSRLTHILTHIFDA
jgi:hypothetical protein